MDGTLPNFLHIGPGKAGSTWLHEVLIRHEEVFLSEAKDLYFFSRFYDRGVDWYRGQFRRAEPHHRIVGEVSPDYLASNEAPKRIYDCLGPHVRLMATVREPVARAFSAYLYLQKHGLAAPTFRETLSATPLILEECRYGTILGRYFDIFDESSIHVALFDDLKADQQVFLDATTAWLGIKPLPIPEDLQEARLPAGQARSVAVARLARQSADWVRMHDGAEIVGRIKRTPLVQRMLYRPLKDRRPTPSAEDIDFVRTDLYEEIARAEAQLKLPLRQRWGWP